MVMLKNISLVSEEVIVLHSAISTRMVLLTVSTYITGRRLLNDLV